jgi:hypothetical protein
MDKGAAPAFGDVVRKKATEIGPGDLLLSFTLVAYLVEAHEGALPALLAAGASARWTRSRRPRASRRTR